jgi:hypothetical protein
MINIDIQLIYFIIKHLKLNGASNYYNTKYYNKDVWMCIV